MGSADEVVSSGYHLLDSLFSTEGPSTRRFSKLKKDLIFFFEKEKNLLLKYLPSSKRKVPVETLIGENLSEEVCYFARALLFRSEQCALAQEIEIPLLKAELERRKVNSIFLTKRTGTVFELKDNIYWNDSFPKTVCVLKSEEGFQLVSPPFKVCFAGSHGVFRTHFECEDASSLAKHLQKYERYSNVCRSATTVCARVIPHVCSTPTETGRSPNVHQGAQKTTRTLSFLVQRGRGPISEKTKNGHRSGSLRTRIHLGKGGIAHALMPARAVPGTL